MVLLRMLCGPVMVVSCCVVLVACSAVNQDDDRPRHRYADLDRFGYVLTNAFRATHPESIVTMADSTWKRPSDEMAIELWIDQNLEYQAPRGTYIALAFAVRQDGDSGRIHYTAAYDRASVPLQDFLGKLSAESSTLSAAIRRIGRLGNVPAKQALDEELEKMGRTKEVTTVIELKEPLTVSDIRKRKHLGYGNAIFSPATAAGPPIYWDYRTTWFCQHCGEDREGMTDDFRFWVNRLESTDEAALNEFGLSLTRLRQVARAGKVYGYIEHDANPVLLRKLLKQDHIRTMYLVRTQAHCADIELNECVPGPWPKNDELRG